MELFWSLGSVFDAIFQNVEKPSKTLQGIAKIKVRHVKSLMKNQLRKHVGTNFDAELSIFDEIGPSWTQEACPGRQRSSKNGARAAEERSRAPRGVGGRVPDAYPMGTRRIPDGLLGGMRGVSGGGGEVNLPGVRTGFSTFV